MTENEFVDKYQNALSDLCGVDYAYMQGDSAVETIVELIRLAVEQKAEIERLKSLERNVYETVEKLKNKIESEARKEFAERLKVKTKNIYLTNKFHSIIDNLLKEMEGK